MSWLDNIIAATTALGGSLRGTLEAATVAQLDGEGGALPCLFNALDWNPYFGTETVRSRMATLSTIDATPTTLYTYEMGDDLGARVRASIVARSPTTNDVYTADIFASYNRNGGGAPTVVGPAPSPNNVAANVGAATWTVALVVVGNDIQLVATGQAATVINWCGYFTAQERT